MSFVHTFDFDVMQENVQNYVRVTSADRPAIEYAANIRS